MEKCEVFDVAGVFFLFAFAAAADGGFGEVEDLDVGHYFELVDGEGADFSCEVVIEDAFWCLGVFGE